MPKQPRQTKKGKKLTQKEENNLKTNIFRKIWIILTKKEVYRPTSAIGLIGLLVFFLITHGAFLMYSVFGKNPMIVIIRENNITFNRDNINSTYQFDVYVTNKYIEKMYSTITIPIANNPNNYDVVCSAIFPDAYNSRSCNGKDFKNQYYEKGTKVYTFNFTIINSTQAVNNTICVQLSTIIGSSFKEKIKCLNVYVE